LFSVGNALCLNRKWNDEPGVTFNIPLNPFDKCSLHIYHRFVAVYPGLAEFHKHGTNVLVFKLYRPV